MEVTQPYTAIIKPRGTLWLALLEVSSAAWAIALSATHVLTGSPRQTRLLLLLETSPDRISLSVCPLSAVISVTFFFHFHCFGFALQGLNVLHRVGSSLSFECRCSH